LRNEVEMLNPRNIIRQDHELPQVFVQWGWKYHHLGIPTKEKKPAEKYVPQYKFFVSGFETSPFGIEWMRFEPDSPISPIIQTIPHVAFEVDNLERELARSCFTILSQPGSPSKGVRVAMIVHNGAPIELIEFSGRHGMEDNGTKDL
jgi:hypothetical protein